MCACLLFSFVFERTTTTNNKQEKREKKYDKTTGIVVIIEEKFLNKKKRKKHIGCLPMGTKKTKRKTIIARMIFQKCKSITIGSM